MKRFKDILNNEFYDENTKKKIIIIKNILGSLIILFFITLSIIFIYKGLDNKKIMKVYYSENNEIDYKVYLKENNFFENSYLPSNKTYISSLIDYIDINFNYNMNYSDYLSGNYNYYITSTIMANKVGSETDNYWSKKYKIFDDIKLDFINKNNFSINENIKIDYQYYNDLLTSFKKEYGLAINGILKVELYVFSNVKYLEEEVYSQNILEVQIPLTQLSLDIRINTDTNELKKDPIVNVVESNKLIYKIYLIIGILLSIVSLIILILFIKSIIKRRKKVSKYIKEIKKILETYDSIIVNIKKFNDLNNYNVISVNTFEELIDAHREVRLPINYVEIEKDKSSMFILVKGDIAWVYAINSD